jgi:hypothetical protein
VNFRDYGLKQKLGGNLLYEEIIDVNNNINKLFDNKKRLRTNVEI